MILTYQNINNNALEQPLAKPVGLLFILQTLVVKLANSWITTIVGSNELGTIYHFHLKQLKYEDP